MEFYLLMVILVGIVSRYFDSVGKEGIIRVGLF